MSKCDSDSNSESYKSLSDEDSKMLTAREDDDSTSEVESSDETVDEKQADKVKVANDIDEPGIEDGNKTTTAVEHIAEASTSNIENTTNTSELQLNDALNQLESVYAASNTEIGNANRTKYSRGEKKARRLLIKQGAKPLPNISRVVMRQGMVLFVIEEAEIYKNPRSDTFIIFGEVKIEDEAKQQENLLACSQIRAAQSIAKVAKLHASAMSTKSAEEVACEEELDETGIDPTDINLVMMQASTTRAKAVQALKASKNDIVNAIMELTM